MSAAALHVVRGPRAHIVATPQPLIQRNATRSPGQTPSMSQEMSYQQACAQIVANNRRCTSRNADVQVMHTDVAFADRGDPEDYALAAAQVLHELESGTYENDTSNGYQYSLLGAVDRMVGYLLQDGCWAVDVVDDHNTPCYVEMATRNTTTPAKYLRAKGTTQFACQFRCFLDRRASVIKRARLAVSG